MRKEKQTDRRKMIKFGRRGINPHPSPNLVFQEKVEIGEDE